MAKKRKKLFIIESYKNDMQRVGDEIVFSYEVGGNKVKPHVQPSKHKEKYATVAYVDKKIDEVKGYVDIKINEVKEEIKEINVKLNKLTERVEKLTDQVEKLTDLFFKFVKKNNK